MKIVHQHSPAQRVHKWGAVSHLEQLVEYLRWCYAPQPVDLIWLESAASRLIVQNNAAATVVSGPDALDGWLARQGFRPVFLGWSPAGERLAILECGHRGAPGPAPSTFRVTAIVPVYNEADIVKQTLEYLVQDGIGVYVIDNWSTDSTLDIVKQFEGRGLVGVEQFPSDGASATYDLRAILGRVEEVASALDADWVVLHDADERRRSAWPEVGLRDALYHVDRSGFSCVDHVTLNFWPIDNGYDEATDALEAYFEYFEFSDHPGHFHQRRAWKKLGGAVSLVPTAGHDVGFSGRRIYPFKFLLKHYPIRSQEHGLRKVLRERASRWNAAERALGWHAQYDQVQTFVRRPGELERFDRRAFYERRLVERLSGVGIFERPPEWATPPMWTA